MLKSEEDRIKDLKKMSDKDLIKRAKTFAKKYYVGEGKKFKLKDYSTSPKMTLGPEDKPLVKEALEQGVDALAALQEILYAQDRWSLLVIFQAMDAAGKDGGIKHVMSGVNPQGCQVSSFKAPSAEELDHDFLWRCFRRVPERGRIGIFNRSYYEEVLVVKVHEAILQSQKLPKKLITKNIWKQRYEDIRNFEQYLHRNGTVVIKLFLHVSKEEQKQRFIDRIDDPSKNWKFSTGDVKERGYWNQYQEAYEEMIKNTSTKDSPWYVIPADNKSYARIGIASAIISALDQMDLEYPQVSPEKIAELQEVKKALLEEKE
ncbi:polyphosphate kinase 2 family protein [Algoriphagus boritolerans]|uniref:Polyphosphate:nucleotide phosphotransferase, PPK2 family n=1 Tax=Algoriphagus boritolerans DSM 17298 = JCM 18970 TaxID=1120964 RepID=A0A1H5YIN3_9BACT|nr:polyphosphate kinase 2 family protein [Algoriphagus boritolerans]SEG23560.1 polyphosphate:nucleotide phosphotransferase, PPK2 family [Algoriphagus boritolerans DSM 17298 = JCM 18970]